MLLGRAATYFSVNVRFAPKATEVLRCRKFHQARASSVSFTSTRLLQERDGSGWVCVRDDHRECAPPENASGSVPIARPPVESSDIYSGSTPARNFEIGSSLRLAISRTRTVRRDQSPQGSSADRKVGNAL